MFIVIGSIDAETFELIELVFVIAVIVVVILRRHFSCKVDHSGLTFRLLLIHSVFIHSLNKSLQLFVHQLLRVETIILTSS